MFVALGILGLVQVHFFPDEMVPIGTAEVVIWYMSVAVDAVLVAAILKQWRHAIAGWLVFTAVAIPVEAGLTIAEQVELTESQAELFYAVVGIILAAGEFRRKMLFLSFKRLSEDLYA